MVQERTLPQFQAQDGQISRDEGLLLYEDMVLGRLFEDKCAEMYYRGKMFGFVHLYNGQEAVSTGVIRAMRRDYDYVCSTYRDHVHALSAGVPAREVMAELFGKATGCSKGRGGSMHIFSEPHHLLGGFAFVAEGIPVATGAAFTSKYHRDALGDPNADQVTACFFGDGACNNGQFFECLNHYIGLARDSLIIKRKVLERFTRQNLYPYAKFYLRDVKAGTGLYWKNHFATIGIVGMNEACLNFLGEGIGDPGGQAFALRVMDHLRGMMADIQEETGDLFNLEATPAEGTSYRLCRLDKKKFPDIRCANEEDYRQGAAPYYTNSTQLPVNYTDDLFETLMHQDVLQTKYTGGTVQHLFLGEMVDDVDTVKRLVRKVTGRFRLPYFTLTPTFSVCASHGYLKGEQPVCPTCRQATEVYSRIVGYLRPVGQWNDGKRAEYANRRPFGWQQPSAVPDASAAGGRPPEAPSVPQALNAAAP